MGKKHAKRSVTKPKNKTPKAKTPTEMKNPRTHFSAKINQLEKAIAKANDFEEKAKTQCVIHRTQLEESSETCAKDFLKLKLSDFILKRRDDLRQCEYTDEDGIETSLAHDVAQLLRGLADLVDTRNAEVEALEAELEAKKRRFAEWQMKDLIEKTGLSTYSRFKESDVSFISHAQDGGSHSRRTSTAHPRTNRATLRTPCTRRKR